MTHIHNILSPQHTRFTLEDWVADHDLLTTPEEKLQHVKDLLDYEANKQSI